jgi:nucleoside-diphosphate-sugar epimerase
MVNVLVLGATGHIGGALCHSLITSGSHRVYGLARSPEKARQLAQNEVIPVLGSLSSAAGLVDVVYKLNINVIVDASSAKDEVPVFLQALVESEKIRLSVISSAGLKAPKLGFIYTSGTWVHGSSHVPKNDLYPVGMPENPDQPPTLLTYRPGLEREFLAASDVLDTMVVRAALVYGRSCDIWTTYFDMISKAASSGASSVSINLDPNSRPALVHVDDVGSGLHAAVDKLPLISGTGVYPVFDLATSKESMRDVLVAAAREMGFKGEVVLSGSGGDLFSQAMSVTGNINSGRAKELLGWQPKRTGFVESMDQVAGAWLAHKEDGNAAERYIRF